MNNQNTDASSKNTDASSERSSNIPELADLLGVSIPTVYAEAKRGKLTISKIGRRSIITPQNRKNYFDNMPTISRKEM